MILMLETGEMREGEQSSREQMRPLVCMSLEDMEWSVSTIRVIAFQRAQDCGDVTGPYPGGGWGFGGFDRSRRRTTYYNGWAGLAIVCIL